MKTKTKQPAILKRTYTVILLSVFMITGIFSQKSASQGLYLNTSNFKKSLPEVLDNLTRKSDCVLNMSTGTSNQNTYEEAIDEEMNIESWMLNEFSINPCKKSIIKDEPVKEEEMQIEDWMLNADQWLTASK